MYMVHKEMSIVFKSYIDSVDGKSLYGQNWMHNATVFYFWHHTDLIFPRGNELALFVMDCKSPVRVLDGLQTWNIS